VLAFSFQGPDDINAEPSGNPPLLTLIAGYVPFLRTGTLIQAISEMLRIRSLAMASAKTHPAIGVCEDPCCYIVGPPRAGTTMLRLMLNRHPEFHVPPETWFFPFLMWRAASYGDLSTAAQIERFANDVARSPAESVRPVSEVFSITAEEITAALVEARVTCYAQAFSAVMSYLARREGKRRWGEKTPFYSAFLQVLGRSYPQARFLVLVRDPRDVAFSIHQTSWGRKQYPTLADAGMRWRYGMTGVEQVESELGPQRLLMLRYEDLVDEPERRVREICDFLEIIFDAAMLHFHEQASDYVPPGAREWHQSLSQPISRSRIGRWRPSYSPEETGLIELTCRRQMRRWGYRREGRSLTVRNLVRIAAWHLERRRKGRAHWTWLLTPRLDA